MAYTLEAPGENKQGKAGPNFPKSQNGTSVSVNQSKGVVRLGPTTCPSSRSASNLKTAYSGRR